MRKWYIPVSLVVLTFLLTQRSYPENIGMSETVLFTRSNKTHIYNAFFIENPLAVGTNPEQRMQITKEPRLSGVKSIGCILAGIGGNIALAYAGAYLGVYAGDSIVEDGYFVGFPLGLLTGSMLGSTLGVYLVGNIGDAKGSFKKALKGSVVGLVLSAGIGLATRNGYALIISAAVLPPLCAFWLFKRSLRYKSPPGYGNALLNWGDGCLRIGVPLVSVCPLPDYEKSVKKSFRVNVKVLSLKF